MILVWFFLIWVSCLSSVEVFFGRNDFGLVFYDMSFMPTCFLGKIILFVCLDFSNLFSDTSFIPKLLSLGHVLWVE